VTGGGRSQARAAIIVAVAVAACGVPVGVLWPLIAPRVEATVVDDGLRLTQSAAQTYVAADGWFAILTVLAGIATGELVALRSRPGGPAAAIALAGGGLLAALVAWRVGVFLGRAPGGPDKPASAAVGETLRLPLELRAYGVLLLWAISAVATFFASVLATGREPAEPTEPTQPAESGQPAYWGGGRPDEPDEVGGGQLDLEAASPGRDEDGRELER
jgi:hypothetical protein